MQHTAKTFNGTSLNTSDIRTTWLNPNALPGSQNVFLSQPQSDSVDSGAYTVEPRTVALQVTILNYANRHTITDTLQKLFKRGTKADFVFTVQEDGLDYQLPCRVSNITKDPDYPMQFTVIMQSGWTAMRAVTADSDSWSASGTSSNKTITVDGTEDTRLSLTFAIAALQTTGYKYQKLYQVPNVVGYDYGVRPWCLTVDTATLVAAGKMQADCDDLRIFFGEQEQRRWISNPNNASTLVWFNLPLGPGYSLTLLTAVASSGDIDRLEFTVSATTEAVLLAMPAEGIVYHGTEWFYYSGKNPKAGYLNIVTRGFLDTTKQAHSASDTFAYIQTPIIMAYGNTAAVNPSTLDTNYDSTKPLFKLASSSNTSWVYDSTTLFMQESQPGRTGAWIPFISRVGKVSKTYIYEGAAISGNPVLGVLAGAWKKGSKWKADDVVAGWSFYSAGGISQITPVGRKYRSKADWLDVVGFQSSPDNVNWATVLTVSTPTAISTWQSYSPGATSVTNTHKWIRHIVDSTYPGKAQGKAYWETQSITVTFPSGTLPTGTLLSEKSSYSLDVEVSVNTSGHKIKLKLPMVQGKTLVLDGENYQATYDGMNVHQAVTLDDQSRTAWLGLEPGENIISITGTDLGTLTITPSWYVRRL